MDIETVGSRFWEREVPSGDLSWVDPLRQARVERANMYTRRFASMLSERARSGSRIVWVRGEGLWGLNLLDILREFGVGVEEASGVSDVHGNRVGVVVFDSVSGAVWDRYGTEDLMVIESGGAEIERAVLKAWPGERIGLISA